MNLRGTILSLLMFPLSAFAGITGNYIAEGIESPNIEYTSALTITRSGSIYKAHWLYPDGTEEVGTGVRKDNSLAFIYSGVQSNYNGVILYEIKGHTLEGPWTRQDGSKTGFEKATKIHTHSHQSH
jgi:hypothetical protein